MAFKNALLLRFLQSAKTSNLWALLTRSDLFDFDKLCDDECIAEFCSLKKDIYVLKGVLQIPDEIACCNRLVVDGIDALCVLLM